MATVLDSPEYAGLKIFVGGVPIKGAFYSPYYGQAMTKISKQSHGSGTLATAWKINTSPWNQSHCTYRESSANCGSAVAAGPINYNNGWLALCQGDVQDWAADLGIAYPVIWIPTADWKEPGDLAPKLPVFKMKPVPEKPKFSAGPISEEPVPPPEEPVPPPSDPILPDPVDKAGYGWLYALLGIGLLVIGGVVVSKKKKK